jgi:putative hydrolase of the HAD superfamily
MVGARADGQRGKPMADEGFEAVLLDAGGVLVLPEHGMVRAALACLGLAAEDERIDAAHYAGIAGHDGHPPGPGEWRAYLDAYARHLGVPEAALERARAEFGRAFAAPQRLWMRPIEASRAALWALAARGVRLGVVSNAEGTVAQRLAELAICQLGPGPGVEVEVVIDSHLVGVEKPDPGIFDHALDAMRLDPARCLYVGDSVRNDVRGARAAGLVPVLLDPSGRRDSEGSVRVQRLAELAALLGGA